MFTSNLDKIFKVGIAGPVGSGKTALVTRLCEKLSDTYSMGVVTNDIYTREDAEFLLRNNVMPMNRVRGVETGGCPHSAIRDDASMNLDAIEDLQAQIPDLELVLVESGGDNLGASFSPELVDIWVYVIDVAAGDKIPRKGGPGIIRSDLLIINKIDLAPLVGASLEVMNQDTRRLRGDHPYVFADLKHETGLNEIIVWLKDQILNRQPARWQEPVSVYNDHILAHHHK